MITHGGYDGVVAGLYATIGDTSAWPQALEALRAEFDCSVVDLNSNFFGVNQSLSTAPLISTEWLQRWSSSLKNPLNSKRMAPGSVALGRDLIAQERLIETAYYNEFLLPADIPKVLMLRGTNKTTGGSVLNVLRGVRQPEFAEVELALARRLSSHFLNALRASEMLGWKSWTELTGSLEAAREAMILVDATGGILHMNRVARALTDSRDGILVSRKQLDAVFGLDAIRLRKAIWQAACAPTGRTGAMLRIERPSGARPLIVSITPTAGATIDLGAPYPCALIAILDHSQADYSSAESLSQLFGVTRREAEIAEALAAGLSIAEAAERCGVTLATARNYLARILRKTNSNRQGELVVLLNGLSRLADASRRS